MLRSGGGSSRVAGRLLRVEARLLGLGDIERGEAPSSWTGMLGDGASPGAG